MHIKLTQMAEILHIAQAYYLVTLMNSSTKMNFL